MMFVNQINLNWFSDTIIVFSNHWFVYLVNIAIIKFGAHGSLEIDVKSVTSQKGYLFEPH